MRKIILIQVLDISLVLFKKKEKGEEKKSSMKKLMCVKR